MKGLFPFLAMAVVAVLGACAAQGQTQFVKYKGNPVMLPAQCGLPGVVQVHHQEVRSDGSLYHMWYTADNGNIAKIHYAASRDGLAWCEYDGNPVLDIGPPGSIDDIAVLLPRIVMDGTVYHMYYAALSASNQNFIICHATSEDGLNWTKDAWNNPVLSGGASGQWDAAGVTPSTVLKQGDTWKMWYEGSQSNQRYHTGYATSSDGISWTKHPANPVIEAGPPGSWDELEQCMPEVMVDGSTYKLWYAGNWPSKHLGYATSPDGIVWTKFTGNPILSSGPEPYDATYFMQVDVVEHEGVYRLWYSAAGQGVGPICFAVDSEPAFVAPDRCDLDFLPRGVGQDADTMTLSVTNYGRQGAQITGISTSGSNFRLVGTPALPVGLDATATLDILVAFAPQGAGEIDDSLVVLTDAPNGERIVTPLSGKGLVFAPVEAGRLYAVKDSLFTVDRGSGTASGVGPLLVGYLDGLALRPPQQMLYGIRTTLSSSTLYQIDHVTGGASSAAAVPVGNMRAIAFSPSGSLFGATKGGLLLRIDPETGDTSAIGSSTGITYSSLSFSPSGVLYASVQPPIANRDAIYRVDTSNGSTTLVGKTGDNAVTPAIAFDGSGRLYGLKGTGTQQNTLIMIDTLNAQGTVIGPTGTTGLQAMIMRTDVAVAVGEPDGIPPLAFALLQNYPNPFNPTTMIEYTLPRAGYATLRVYTVLGEEVATLIDREHAPGTFKASWDASAMPSGIYFYRLSAGEHVQTRKMTLIR